MTIEKKHVGNITWVDLVSPKPEDIRTLIDDHMVHPSLGDELVSPSLRPHSKSFHDTFFISLQVPILIEQDGKPRISNQEVDFTIKDNSLVTTRYSDYEIFDNFTKFFEAKMMTHHESHLSGTRLFFDLLTYIYKSLYDHLDQYRDALRDCEDGIFDGEELAMVKELSRIHQQLLRYDESLRFHEDILQNFSEYHQDAKNTDDVLLIETIQSEYERVTHSLEINLSYLHELRDTNNSLLSINQNNTIQLLTVLAYVSLPATIIASIFGMNAKFMPFIGDPHDFWILISMMVLVSFSLFLFFRYKKWL